MKSILILIASVFICVVHSLPPVPLFALNKVNDHWSEFKKTHNKTYRNSTHEAQKKQLFTNTLQKINDHNQRFNNGTETYTMGITQFVDWSQSEYIAYVKAGGISSDSMPPKVKSDAIIKMQAITLAASIDWRNISNKNYVQSIKDQGSCGSCWAFASVSALESYTALATGQLPNLSEQNLVDCTYVGKDGCNGGADPDAFNYILNNGGIATKANYPYVSGTSGTWNGKCNYLGSMNSGVILKGYTQVTGGDTGLTQALATIGPITAYIYAGSMNFAYYKSGIYSDTACTGQTINHAVMLVGYAANATGTPYYILRNSWGTTWGMNGYMYISRGNNMCSVSSYNYYPKNVTLNSNLTTVAPLITTTTSSKTNAPLNKSSTVVAASTTSTAKTTTYSVITSTSTLTPSPLNKTCTNGSGYYAYSGCQNYYYCLDNIYNSYCPTGYKFDQVNQYCTNTNITCLVTPGICMNGTGWYTYPGCNSVYYCTRTITNYTTPSASTLFNPSTNSFVSSSNFKCPF